MCKVSSTVSRRRQHTYNIWIGQIQPLSAVHPRLAILYVSFWIYLTHMPSEVKVDAILGLSCVITFAGQPTNWLSSMSSYPQISDLPKSPMTTLQLTHEPQLDWTSLIILAQCLLPGILLSTHPLPLLVPHIKCDACSRDTISCTPIQRTADTPQLSWRTIHTACVKSNKLNTHPKKTTFTELRQFYSSSLHQIFNVWLVFYITMTRSHKAVSGDKTSHHIETYDIPCAPCHSSSE